MTTLTEGTKVLPSYIPAHLKDFFMSHPICTINRLPAAGMYNSCTIKEMEGIWPINFWLPYNCENEPL